jgi:hypothetical protein
MIVTEECIGGKLVGAAIIVEVFVQTPYFIPVLDTSIEGALYGPLRQQISMNTEGTTVSQPSKNWTAAEVFTP